MQLTSIYQSYEDLAFGGLLHPEMFPDRLQRRRHPRGLPPSALVLLRPLSLFTLGIVPSLHPPPGEIPLPGNFDIEEVPGWSNRGSDAYHR